MKTTYRVLIFDDDEAIRQMLWTLFDKRGYEVFTFPHPATCPLSGKKNCPCPDDQSCSDIIISDVEMPFKNGLAFIEEQLDKGCKCKHIALMSGAFTDEDLAKAKSLGLTIFVKPFRFKELLDWVSQIERQIDSKRVLTDWFLNKKE